VHVYSTKTFVFRTRMFGIVERLWYVDCDCREMTVYRHPVTNKFGRPTWAEALALGWAHLKDVYAG
jgi:hypothetical protein